MFTAGVIPDESLPVQLQIAAANGHIHLVEFLLTKRHPDIFDKDLVYVLPIHRGHTEIVKLLARAQGIDHVKLEHHLVACGTKNWVDWLRTGMFERDWCNEDFSRSFGLFIRVLKDIVKCPDRTELLRKMLARGITMDVILVDDPSFLSLDILSFLTDEGLVPSKDALDTALQRHWVEAGHVTASHLHSFKHHDDFHLIHDALYELGARLPTG